MKSSWIRVLTALSLLLVCRCGGGDDAPPVDIPGPDPLPLGLTAEVACFADGLESGRSAAFGMVALYRKIQDSAYAPPAPNAVALDLGADPATFDIDWDVDGDGTTAETNLFGELTPEADLSEGLDFLDFVDSDWVLEVSGAEVGYGSFRLTRISQDQVRIVGSADFPSEGCRFEITSMDLEFIETQDLGAVPDGVLNFRTNDGVMIGLITFAPPSTIAQVAVSYDGEIMEFGFDLATGQAIFD